MNISKFFRVLYIKTTNFTKKYQSRDKKLINFYKIWSYCYDISISLDPAYKNELKKMINLTVKDSDITLDIGCGTGISTIYASKIANEVIGIDLSSDMIYKLKKKINKKNIKNIKLINGKVPEKLPQNLKFNSIISSFAIVHFTPEDRKKLYKQIFDLLLNKGKTGLFLAQGEIAPSFETKDEIVNNLKESGFKNIKLFDVADIYRIVIAEKL